MEYNSLEFYPAHVCNLYLEMPSPLDVITSLWHSIRHVMSRKFVWMLLLLPLLLLLQLPLLLQLLLLKLSDLILIFKQLYHPMQCFAILALTLTLTWAKAFLSNRTQIVKINAQSASLRTLVAAESIAAEIKAAVACFESVCQLLTGICLECVCQL